MISPSRKRRTPPVAQDGLNLHRRLARARDLNRHLTLASLLALVAALLGWALNLDLGLRAAVVAAGASIAWLVPLAGSESWALRWIGDRTGLAYQTSLEAPLEPDRYGMRSALEARALDSLARVDRPTHGAWWLPLLALALGALLLPALPLIPGAGSGLGGSSGPVTPPAVPAGTAEEPEELSEPELPDQQRARVDPGEPGAEGGRREDEGDLADGGAAGERAALERFLRNVRERPEGEREESEESETSSSNRPVAPRGGEEGETGSNRGSERRREADEPGEAGQQGEEGASTEGEQGAGEEGANPFAEAGAGEQPDGEREPGESDEPVAAGGEPGKSQEPGQEASGSPGEGAGEEEGLGEGAGNQASAERPAQPGDLEPGQPLFLEGDLRSGPLAPGGAVQLPGSDQAEPPGGAASETYQREVERAVSEGRIPLEYQEIIRNYFR
jgi:hypothetical protein